MTVDRWKDTFLFEHQRNSDQLPELLNEMFHAQSRKGQILVGDNKYGWNKQFRHLKSDVRRTKANNLLSYNILHNDWNVRSIVILVSFITYILVIKCDMFYI